MQQLATQFNDSHSQDTIEAGKIAAVKHVLQKIQAEIEVVYLTVKKRQEAIKKSTSKIPFVNVSIDILICTYVQLLVNNAPTYVEVLLQIKLKFMLP